MALYRFTKKNGKIRINNVSKNVMLHQTRISCPMGNTQVQGHRLWWMADLWWWDETTPVLYPGCWAKLSIIQIFQQCLCRPILRGGHLQAQLHASVVRMHAETKSRPPGIMSKEQLESLSRNKFTTNKVLSYRPKDDDVSPFKNLLEKGTRPRQDHLVAATSWPSSEAMVTSVKWPASGRAEDDLGCDEFLCLKRLV